MRIVRKNGEVKHIACITTDELLRMTRNKKCPFQKAAQAELAKREQPSERKYKPDYKPEKGEKMPSPSGIPTGYHKPQYLPPSQPSWIIHEDVFRNPGDPRDPKPIRK